MESRSVPRAGDVLFCSSNDIGTFVSRLVQQRLDPDATGAARSFGHVAVVISNLLALEAVPSNPKDMRGQTATLKDTIAIGEWTGVELRGGVRLIPLADLVVPAMQRSEELMVLRSLDADEEALSTFSPHHPVVLRMLGSRYSIDELREQVVTWGPKNVMSFLASSMDWTSAPTDLATRVSLDPELRKSIEERFPHYSLFEVARTYFCSQAVIRCLRIVGLIPDDFATELTTPTGLYRLLTDRKWADVSALYKCAPDVRQYLGRTPSMHSNSYSSTLILTGFGIRKDVLGLELGFIKSSMEAITRLCDDIERRLPPHGPESTGE